MITADRDVTNNLIRHVLKTFQENVQDEALTDVNGRQITFRATDDLDKGLNGTDGMSYSLIGDGKFQSEKGFKCAPASNSWISIPDEYGHNAMPQVCFIVQ